MAQTANDRWTALAWSAFSGALRVKKTADDNFVMNVHELATLLHHLMALARHQPLPVAASLADTPTAAALLATWRGRLLHSGADAPYASARRLYVSADWCTLLSVETLAALRQFVVELTLTQPNEPTQTKRESIRWLQRLQLVGAPMPAVKNALVGDMAKLDKTGDLIACGASHLVLRLEPTAYSQRGHIRFRRGDGVERDVHATRLAAVRDDEPTLRSVPYDKHWSLLQVPTAGERFRLCVFVAAQSTAESAPEPFLQAPLRLEPFSQLDTNPSTSGPRAVWLPLFRVAPRAPRQLDTVLPGLGFGAVYATHALSCTAEDATSGRLESVQFYDALTVEEPTPPPPLPATPRLGAGDAPPGELVVCEPFYAVVWDREQRAPLLFVAVAKPLTDGTDDDSDDSDEEDSHAKEDDPDAKHSSCSIL